VAGRAEDLATTYRGVAAEARRHRYGVLLRPGPLDGELFGVRLPRIGGAGPPGRGVAIADASWGPQFADGDPVPIQVALP
jgi:S-DNA-T family DNA segregation ATPase FtsK/SpoIIIE